MTRPAGGRVGRRKTRRSPYADPSGAAAGPAPLAAGGPAGPVRIRGIEVTQTVQALDNSVRLIAGKPTVVRVYVDPDDVGGARLTGELTWRRGAGGAFYLPAMNRVEFGAGARPTIAEQRNDVALSLNFRLPEDALGAGVLTLELNRLTVPGGADVAFEAPPAVSAAFVGGPPLRIRVIGLRYRSGAPGGATVAPDALHFAYLKSYLTRAYPVSSIEWSQIVVDADLLAPPFNGNTSNLVNAQLLALRSSELSSGADPRTHYFGLVDDDRGRSFMRGSAVYSETTKVFGPVACGPCGAANGWEGDFDASYADWYGAHELGHTFQRRHPGFPTNEQPRDPDENDFPYDGGLISSPDQRYVGFDMGDAALGLPMQALPGNRHHDFMTYAERQWVSAYTYEGIHDRLLFEDEALAPAVG